MRRADLWHHAAEIPDPEDEDPSSCPTCGLVFAEVTSGHVLWDEDPETGYDRWRAVNRETGCMCSPEDLEGEALPPVDMSDLPF